MGRSSVFQFIFSSWAGQMSHDFPTIGNTCPLAVFLTTFVHFKMIKILNSLPNLRYLLLFYFLPLSFISNGQDLPISPATGLVSINNVVHLDGKSQKVLKGIAELFISSNSDPAAINYNPKLNNKVYKIWPFTAEKILDNDSTLIYNCMLKFSENGPFEKHFIIFKINFYLKDSRFKYDISNLLHKNLGTNNGMIGDQFEIDKPVRGSKIKWHQFKLKVLETAITPLAKSIEDFFTKEFKSQTDF